MLVPDIVDTTSLYIYVGGKIILGGRFGRQLFVIAPRPEETQDLESFATPFNLVLAQAPEGHLKAPPLRTTSMKSGGTVYCGEVGLYLLTYLLTHAHLQHAHMLICPKAN